VAKLGGSRLPSRGLHHVTTIIGDVQRAADFYADILGLKRVKKTVCYDDPGSYHLYFGDDAGSPGTVISTLAWRCVAKGMVGVGEVVQTAFQVPAGSFEWWSERLKAANVVCRLDHSPLGEPMLCFADPDGTALALMESKRVHYETERRDDRQAVLGLNEVTLPATAATIRTERPGTSAMAMCMSARSRNAPASPSTPTGGVGLVDSTLASSPASSDPAPREALQKRALASKPIGIVSYPKSQRAPSTNIAATVTARRRSELCMLVGKSWTRRSCSSMMRCVCGVSFDSHKPDESYDHRRHIYAAQGNRVNEIHR
jgi:catechol 2,3-dioxygenase-like lactoylglutathione lyase family enzyme